MRRVIAWSGTLLLCLAACGGDDSDEAQNRDVDVIVIGPGTGGSTASNGQSTSAPPKAQDGSAGSASMPSATPTSGPNAAPSSTPASGQTTNTMAMPTSNTMSQGQNMAPSKDPPASQPMAQPQMSEPPKGIAPPEGFKPNAMNECDLHSGWPGDEYCILPPPPDKGFQLHIGPSSYDKPEAIYLLDPGEESVHAFTTKSANDKDIQFYVRQYRMRPGAHHTIVRDTSTGRRLSGSNVNQDHPLGGITAPENAGIGLPLIAHAPITVDHHAINTTEKQLLQEVWVNFWYVDPAKVTETTTLLYDPGSVSATVAPHADVVLGPYECDIKQPGRLISMFGHVHANNVSFSAWRTRGGKRESIYESYHWEEPLWVEFTSLAKNPVADASKKLSGGWTGVLDLQPGDTIGWECHEVNQQDTALRFTNQTYTGVMCIIIGDLVGTKCQNRTGLVIDPNLE